MFLEVGATIRYISFRNLLPKNSKLASGIATSDSTGTATIVFDPSFKTAPSVCAIPYGSSTDTAIAVKVNELTAERCVLKVISAQNGGSVSALSDSRIYWIALSK